MRLITFFGLISGLLVCTYAQSPQLEADLFSPDLLDAYTASEVQEEEWSWLEEPAWEEVLTEAPTGYVTLNAQKSDHIDVYLDGEHIGCLCGEEPLILKGEPGPYTLELRQPDGKTWYQRVTILSSTPKQYTLLTP